jgi:hypothetical protein
MRGSNPSLPAMRKRPPPPSRHGSKAAPDYRRFDSLMKFVPSDYRSTTASGVEMWRHPTEPDGVVTRFGLLASAVLEAVTL